MTKEEEQRNHGDELSNMPDKDHDQRGRSNMQGNRSIQRDPSPDVLLKDAGGKSLMELEEEARIEAEEKQ